MTCPVDGKVKPANVVVEKVEDYESSEVHYDMNGIAVFSRNDDIFEIRKKTGKKIRVSLVELRKHADVIHEKMKKDVGVFQNWQYESLEDILKSAMLEHEIDFISLLRKDDLITPMTITKEQLDSVRMKRTDDLLKTNNVALPIGFFEISTLCTYKKIDEHRSQGICASPRSVAAYKDGDYSSEKVIEASLTWAHLLGRPKQIATLNAPENKEELLVFAEQGDWVRMKLVVLEESKRTVWINKKDVPFQMVRLQSVDRIKTLIQFLNPPNVASPRQNIDLAENLKTLVEKPLDLDIESANEAKWVNDVLWVKVNIKSQPQCSGNESEKIGTGWLPYVDPKTKKKVLKWISRGC